MLRCGLLGCFAAFVLVAWAEAMGHTDAVSLLQEILDEEKATDEKLTSLAEAGINQEAADASHSGDEDEEEEEEEEKSTGRGKRQPAGRKMARQTVSSKR